MSNKAFQDFYPAGFDQCYGCGGLNEHGLQIKSYWDGEESVAIHKPRAEHNGVPGFVYGGLIASLIDCHGVGTAVAATYRAEGRNMGTEPALRFVTASLHVDFLAPTPMGVALEVRGIVKTVTKTKAIIEVKIIAQGKVCAKGEVIAVPVPATMAAKITS